MVFDKEFSEKILLSDDLYRKATKTKADRMSHLAKALIGFAEQKINKSNLMAHIYLDRAIHNLKESNKLYSELGYFFSSIINGNIELSYVYFLENDLENAEKYIMEAINLKGNLTKREICFMTIPLDILTQGILVMQGRIEKKSKNLKKAAEFFTKSISNIEKYDTNLKKM